MCIQLLKFTFAIKLAGIRITVAGGCRLSFLNRNLQFMQNHFTNIFVFPPPMAENTRKEKQITKSVPRVKDVTYTFQWMKKKTETTEMYYSKYLI